jgi:hypothetical protein
MPASRSRGAGERLAAGARRSGARHLAPPVDPFAVTFVKTFALVPALLATIAAVLVGDRAADRRRCAAGRAVRPGVVIVAAGDSIELHHQRILGSPGPAFWWCRRSSCPS